MTEAIGCWSALHAHVRGTALIAKELLFEPNVRLYGPIGDERVRDCLRQILEVIKGDKPLVLELTTQGGDADGGRRIALK